MRKKRIYLDTTVISHLRHGDVPDKMAETLEFWEILKKSRYDVYISEVVMIELMRCPEPKRSELLAHLGEMRYTEIEVEGNAEILALADEIKQLSIMPPKSENDRRHIAAAIYSECHIIVSWNFQHFVNEKTIDGVRKVCLENNISHFVDIYTPAVLLERGVLDG